MARPTQSSQPGKRAEPEVLVVSDDSLFADSLCRRLEIWGLRVVRQAWQPLKTAGSVLCGPLIVLLDIRQSDAALVAEMAGGLQRPHEREIILVNRPDNIQASMAGMRAGADDELTVPFDVEWLRQAVAAAKTRLSRQSKPGHRRSFLQAFSDAMAAATFAQAGDFDTAVEMLDPPQAAAPPGRHDKKK